MQYSVCGVWLTLEVNLTRISAIVFLLFITSANAFSMENLKQFFGFTPDKVVFIDADGQVMGSGLSPKLFYEIMKRFDVINYKFERGIATVSIHEFLIAALSAELDSDLEARTESDLENIMVCLISEKGLPISTLRDNIRAYLVSLTDKVEVGRLDLELATRLLGCRSFFLNNRMKGFLFPVIKLYGTEQSVHSIN